jgi:hypothetical protein
MPVAYVNPSNVFDGNSATFASGLATADIAICRWTGWGAATGPYAALKLLIDNDIAAPTASVSTAWLGYSTDGGNTWKTIYSVTGANLTRTRRIDTIVLPASTNLALLQVRASIQTSSGTTSLHRIYEVSSVGTLVSGTVILLSLANQSANVCVTPPTDPQETALRLYRRGGTLTNNYFQVGQYPVASLVQGGCGVGTLQINDNVPDSVVQTNPIMPLDNFQPIQSVQAQNFPLPVVFGPYDTRVLGCGDPARPESVYFSIRGNADIWPAENWVVVGNPGELIMNGIVYSLRCFAFSRERMFILLPNIIAGVTFTPSETSCRRGLRGRWGLCAGEQGVYFVSKDGVYRTQGGPEQSVIDDSIRPLFPVREGTVGKPTNGYDAVDMSNENALRLVFHNSEIWFFYMGLTTQEIQLLIYDERRSRWRGADYPDFETIAYSEPSTTSSLLLGAADGDLYQISGAVDGENNIPIPVNFRTGAFDQGRPLNLKEYADVVIDIDPGGATAASPVVITPIVNGETLTEQAINVTGSGRQRVPLPLNQTGTEVYAYNIEFDFAWNATAAIQPIAYQYDILYRHESAELTHWELPPTSMGIQGWQHIRDVYVTLRSTSPVSLTVTPSGTASQVFTLPSTNGIKQKLYIQLGPSKAKTYSFAMDSQATFRLYADEMEVRTKQWNTKLGYQNVPVIGREQVGRPFGLVNV